MKQFLLFSAFILFFLSSIFSFSQAYKVDEMRVYEWDDVSDPADWKQQLTNQYTYGNEGNKETNVLSLSFPGGEKVFQQKKTYNASNNIKLNVTQWWNPEPPGAWQNSSQIIYVYDGDKLTTETTQTYVSMEFQDTFQIDYGYEDNNLIRETYLNYDFVSMQFVNSTQELYEYSGADIFKETSQHWETGPGWVDDEIFEVISYESPGKPLVTIDNTWNSFTNMWEIERATATYNAGLITKIEFHISDGVGGWDLDGQTLFEYPSALVTIITDQNWEDPEWVTYERSSITNDGNGNRIAYILEEADSGPLVFVNKVENDFSAAAPFSLSAESFNKENFKVFPNPVSDVINLASSVSIEKVELFDILGKKVMSSSNTKQLNVERLKSGMYVLKVFSDNRSVTKKIIIK